LVLFTLRSIGRMRHVGVLAFVVSAVAAQVQVEAPSCAVSADSGGTRIVSSASSELALGLRLTRMGRGDQLDAVPPVAPRGDGERIVYSRGGGIEEHWVVRATGLEFYVELAQRPSGSGDYVVRYELDPGAAQPAAATEGGIAWTVPGLGTISMGGVTVLAADGAHCSGSLAIVDGELELRAPGAFVDAAAFPLRLDPLVGTVTMISQPHPFYDNSARESDIAHDAALDRFLVVWREPASSTGFDVRAHLTDANGAKIGSSLLLASAVSTLAPRVGAVSSSGQFAVAWQEGATVRCRLVRASDGLLSSTISVTTSASSAVGVDVSGDVTGTDDDALVVWRNGTGSIRGAQIATSSGTPIVVTTTELVAKPMFGTLGSVSISKTGGNAARHCLSWETRTVLYPYLSLQYVSARLFDRQLVPIGAALALSSGDSLEEAKPDVDGNGDEFVVVYSKGPQGAPNECYARSVRHSSGALVSYSSETKLSQSNFRHDLGTAVAMSGSKAYALWVEQPTLNSLALRARGLAPNGCLTCEPTFDVALAIPLLTYAFPSIAAERAASGQDRLLATWQSNASGPRLTIQGRPLEAFGPGAAVIDLGGACGSAGTITTSGLCAPGSSDFKVELVGADPSATNAVLWQSFAPFAPVSCGTCVSEAGGLSFLHSLSGGAATHSFSIPCNASLVGTTTRFQWKLYNSSQTPCAQSPGLSQTTRLECTFTQ
jgi:hypothetical protein